MNRLSSFRSTHSYAPWVMSILVLFMLTLPARAQVDGISYTLTPVVERMNFNNETGLKDGPFFGGKLGFGFGEYVELSALYLLSSGIETEFNNLLPPRLDPALFQRKVNIRRYGGALKFNIGQGNIIPYLITGGGIMQFSPDNLPTSKSVYLNGGIGLQFSIKQRYTLTVQAQSIAYRGTVATFLSDTDMMDIGVTPEDFEYKTLRSYNFGVGLQLYLGGRSRGELSDLDRALQSQFASGLRGFSFQVEPFFGQINFDNALGYAEKQTMAGLSAGINMGPYVGLNAFYWRGIDESSLTSLENLQAYGGEFRLSFASARQSIIPFLNVGGGYLDVLNNYQGNGVAVPDDRAFLIGGGGLSIPVGASISFTGGVRILATTTLDLLNVSAPTDIKTSLMYNAGVNFRFGKTGPTAGELYESDLSQTQQELQTQQDQLNVAMAERERNLARTEARIDSLATALILAQQGDAEAMAWLREQQQAGMLAPDSLGTATSSPDTTATPAAKPVERPAPKTNWVSLPVPVEGELYVRYGAPGGVTVETLAGDGGIVLVDPVTGQVVSTTAPTTQGNNAAISRAQIQDIVRQVLREELTRSGLSAPQGAQVDSLQMATMNQQFETRIADMEQRLNTQIQEIQQQQAQPAQTTPPPAQNPALIPVPVDGTTAQQQPDSGVRSLRLVAGYNLDLPKHGILGIRIDFRNPSTGQLRFMPEFLLGVGGDEPAYTINLNLAYPVFRSNAWQLYLGTGFGLHSQDTVRMVFNLLGGVERDFGPGAFFLEYLTQSVFDNNRVMLGYRLNF